LSNSTPSSEPTASDSTAPAAPGSNSSDVTVPVADARPAAPVTSTLASSAGTDTMPNHRSKLTRNVTKRAEHKASPTFIQLAHTPLIPERILRQYGAYSWYDQRFRAVARFLQCLWLRDHGIPTASSQARGNASEYPAAHAGYGSILSVEAANAGRNFLSPAIHRHALHSWLMSEPGACYEEVRFFGNSLSSMPLVFNLLAPLALNIDLASQVLRRLLPGFVQRVERIQFETSPGRRDTRFNRRGEGPYLGDRSAFDCAFHTLDPSGTPCIVYTEIKYSETLDHTNIARMRDRYNEASRQVRLYDNPDSLILRSPPIEQFWREHMLAQLAVDNGVTPKAVFLAIGPELNRRVQGAFQVYQGELIEADWQEPRRVPFIPMTLETVIRAIADAGAIDHARALWDRYCDFDRVYRLSMQELAKDASSSASTSTQTPTPQTQLSALPPTRRAPTSMNARRTRTASAPTRGSNGVTRQAAAEGSAP
jgi:PD-(D/E)XK nuclease superfamily protein